MQPLKYGSRGPEVTKLQQMLKDAGFFPQGQSTTEYFGPITEKALKEYQKSKGMPVDGMYNPIVKNTLSSSKETEGFYNMLVNAGNYQGAAQYKDMIDRGDPDAVVIARGYNPATNSPKQPTGLTPEAIQGFRDMVEKEQSGYYNQLQQKEYADTDSLLKQQLYNYDSGIESYQTKLGEDLNTLNDSEGQRGTWASSGRQERLNSLQNTYNTAFKDLYNRTFAQTQDKLRQAEFDTGYKTPQTMNLIQANLSQTKSPQFQTTSSNVYNPFNFVSKLQQDKVTNTETEVNRRLGRQMDNPFTY